MTIITKQKPVAPSFTDDGSETAISTPSERSIEVVSSNDVTASIHSIPSDRAFYLTCKPPQRPATALKHTPCDIVLVIDVSGSMAASAPLPDLEDGAKEESGLSVLDLVKHSGRAIIENLNEGDRLAIVTFSDDATLVQALIPMTDENKKETSSRLEGLEAEGCTNLWSGIRSGLQLFESTEFTHNVQGLFILTDGMPNFMCPKQGYVNKMRPMLANMARDKASAGATMPTIHTFGFGYSIRSDLLQSIAEIGNGNYAFIPDAGMIGTVFVHAVANLFSTFAVNAVLKVDGPPGLPLGCSTVFNTERLSNTTSVLHLGNLQYGQSRDIILTYDTDSAPSVKATLSYKDRFGRGYTMRLDPSSHLAGDEYAYHRLRSQLCDQLSAFSPISTATKEHNALMPDGRDIDKFKIAVRWLREFGSQISSHPLASDPRIASLVNDVTAPDGEQHGQISKAVQTSASNNSRQNYYTRWGRHYLPSLLHAHARQVCNSFKDPGPLMYGQDSPLFIQCRDELDAAFENLPAPKPSRPKEGSYGRSRGVVGSGSVSGVALGKDAETSANNDIPFQVATTSTVPVRMARYNRRSNPCFSGRSKVRLDSDSLLPIEQLHPGHRVWTQAGPSRVVAVLRTDPPADPSAGSVLCKVKKLWVTPWHPVRVNGAWTFPAEIAEEMRVCDEPVYSLLLEQQQQQPSVTDHSAAHTVMVGGVVAVTLGHGITNPVDSQGADIRAHAFFGDWTRVSHALGGLQVDNEGRVLCSGVLRDENTGLVCGFHPKEDAAVEEVELPRSTPPRLEIAC
ncbi:hypothetical protein DV735_g732, partial [Chaetothyriales sp. CBS 134920]